MKGWFMFVAYIWMSITHMADHFLPCAVYLNRLSESYNMTIITWRKLAAFLVKIISTDLCVSAVQSSPDIIGNTSLGKSLAISLEGPRWKRGSIQYNLTPPYLRCSACACDVQPLSQSNQFQFNLRLTMFVHPREIFDAVTNFAMDILCRGWWCWLKGSFRMNIIFGTGSITKYKWCSHKMVLIALRCWE